MPFGGLPEVKYEVEPLQVRCSAAIHVVERLANAVEKWGEMGVRQRYEVRGVRWWRWMMLREVRGWGC